MHDTTRKASLLVIFLTIFIDLLGFGMVLPLLPIYATQFTVDEAGLTIGLLMSSFSAMQFLFAPWWGRLSDRIGRRPVLLIGLTGSVVFYTLFGLASLWQSLTLLFVARIGAGIAGATISTAHAYIADSTTLETRARGMALVGAAFGLGFTFGPLLGAAALLLSDDIGTSPWPGFVAAILSAVALALAALWLRESLKPGVQPAHGKLFNVAALRDALATPSVAPLLVTNFVSLLAFGSFETTISLLLKDEDGAFRYSFEQVLLFFAYIGLVLSVVQGGVVRRLATRISEARMAVGGALTAIAGFVLLAIAANVGHLWLLMLATAVEVTGFAFITPSVNSLVSRRSDPSKQGGILGLMQSAGSLARILGPLISVPLFVRAPTLPYWVAVCMMAGATLLLNYSVNRGRDFR